MKIVTIGTINITVPDGTSVVITNVTGQDLSVPEDALPDWNKLDPKFKERVGISYFDHGPAIGRNSQGQPIDSLGRLAGVIPAKLGDSEIMDIVRLGLVTHDEVTYDKYGYRVSSITLVQLNKEYNSVEELFADAVRTNFPRILIFIYANGARSVRDHDSNGPLSGPESVYQANEFGRVSRTSVN